MPRPLTAARLRGTTSWDCPITVLASGGRDSVRSCRWSRRRGRQSESPLLGRCRHCGYNLTGNTRGIRRECFAPRGRCVQNLPARAAQHPLQNSPDPTFRPSARCWREINHRGSFDVSTPPRGNRGKGSHRTRPLRQAMPCVCVPCP